MERLLVALSEALAGGAAIALGAAFAWGVLSVVFSPCHLASIPLLVGFLGGGRTGVRSARRAWGLAVLFASGILVSIVIIGVATAAAGRLLGDVGPVGQWLVAAVFIVFGLHLMDVLPLPDGVKWQPDERWRGPLAAVAYGAVFGVALGPCTFAFMAPVLGMTFALASERPGYAAALLCAFGIGHCAVIGMAGVSTTWVQRWLQWQGRREGVRWLRRACGVLVLAAGLWFVASAR